MQPSSTPAPRKRRWGLIIGLIAGGTLVLCIVTSIIGNIIGPPPQSAANQATMTPTSTVGHTARATSTSAPTKAATTVIAPTDTPVPTSTPTHATVATNTPTVATGPALLGSNINTFVAKFGPANDHTDVKSGSYHFLRYPGSNVDSLIAYTDVVSGTLVNYLIVAAPANGWSQDEAEGRCAVFFPADAKYQSQVQATGGIDKIYFSASLAQLFPASSFTDADGNQVKPGLFDVNYLVRTGTVIDSCSIIIGTQQTK